MDRICLQSLEKLKAKFEGNTTSISASPKPKVGKFETKDALPESKPNPAAGTSISKPVPKSGTADPVEDGIRELLKFVNPNRPGDPSMFFQTSDRLIRDASNQVTRLP